MEIAHLKHDYSARKDSERWGITLIGLRTKLWRDYNDVDAFFDGRPLPSSDRQVTGEGSGGACARINIPMPPGPSVFLSGRFQIGKPWMDGWLKCACRSDCIVITSQWRVQGRMCVCGVSEHFDHA